VFSYYIKYGWGIIFILSTIFGIHRIFIYNHENLNNLSGFNSLVAGNSDSIPIYRVNSLPNKNKIESITPLQKVDINNATLEELMGVKGIGEITAKRILEYRNAVGEFLSVEEIKQIKGINHRFEQIKPYLYLKSNKGLALSLSRKNKFITKVDLNTITKIEFLNLNIIPSENVHQIIRYRDACKGFRNMDHALKTYNLTNQLKDIISNNFIVVYKKPKLNLHIDINSATTVELEKLPAIGVKLANRIIKYKKLLGYYYCIEQLKEVYFLSDSTYKVIEPYIYVDKKIINYRGILINKIPVDSLARHPYLKDKKMAWKILDYRNRYGRINSTDDLRKIPNMDTETIEKLKPYLNFE